MSVLLDEPTNHLDAESVLWLEHHLAQYKGTVICITHDRYFLDNVAGWILELDRGEGIPWKGNYSSWLEQKQLRLQQEEKTESKRQKLLERELEWVRMGQKARQAKSKARLQNYEKMLAEETKQKEGEARNLYSTGPRLGAKVINAVDVSKSFGDKLLYEHLNFSLPQGGIVGIIRPNGAGKTTLFRMIMGEEKATSGTFEVGDTVKIAYVDQAHSNIDPEKTVWEVISKGGEWIELGKLKMNSRGYVSRFNFNGADQQKKVKILSGGERNRLHLALTLREEANVLLLDEPTNDLDVNTMRALEELLKIMPVAPSLFRMTAGFLTAFVRISLLLKAKAAFIGLRAVSAITKKTKSNASASAMTCPASLNIKGWWPANSGQDTVLNFRLLIVLFIT